jgi:predicted NAD/FAD-binding protein
VDTGFIVYNEPNYPHLSRLFRHLGVATQNTDMSFAVSIDDGNLEYAGDNLSTLFAQRRNLISKDYLLMLKEILRFNMQCKRLLTRGGFDPISLGDFLDLHAYRQNFRDHYLLPMAAAIWSCPTERMLAFPIASLARFFHNHGLLNLIHRPQWKTVSGGSWRYVLKLSSDLRQSLRIDSPVVAVVREPDRVMIQLANGDRTTYDTVVMATHADEALSLLADPSPVETEMLSRFSYQPNQVWLHTDSRLMPRSRQVWSAWNYLATQGASGYAGAVSVSYWMNRLQHLKARRDYLVSLNPLQAPRDDRVIAQMSYHHPVFDAAAMQAQPQLVRLQGQRNTWFCGSYFGYGFHEDALQSSVQVAQSMGVKIPWLERTSAVPASPAVKLGSDLARTTG